LVVGVPGGATPTPAARAATKAALLAAATRLLFEMPGPTTLQRLKPADLVRRADPPRTTGAFYHLWPTQEEFRRDLLAHVLSLDRFAADVSTRVTIEGFLAEPELRLDETIRVAANVNFDQLKNDPAMWVLQALWTDHGADPEVRERLRALYADMTSRLAPLYAVLLERSGRRMRAPYDLQALAVTLACLVEGMHVRWAVDPDAVPDDVGPPPGVTQDEGGRWSMFASVTHTLFLTMTEPVV
jgi:AcrR family transcriptional regulator